MSLDRIRASLSGRYDVQQEVSRGAMASVFAAYDRRNLRRVALKVLHPELISSVALARFDQEMRLSSRLQHPNILPLLDSGDVDGIPYFTMPFVEGATLQSRLDAEKQLSADEALRIAEEVADALEHAHRQGVVHRDIKPANILLLEGHAVVADFGIAQAVATVGDSRMTTPGVVVGTPAYMSPEQASGDTGIDRRTDVYALGCVLYEMLTGEPPFTGRTAQAILARQVSQEPPSVRIVRPDVPAAVDQAVERALAKVPAERFQSAAAFREALRSASRPAGRRLMTGKPAVAAAAAAVIGACAGWWLLSGDEPALDPNRLVVYPLVDDAPSGSMGENVAGMVGYALDGTEPLTWIEGWHLLSPQERDDIGRLTTARAGQLARARGAAHLITGRIVRMGDSVTVLLALHDAVDGDVLESTGATGPAAEGVETSLALRSLPRLLIRVVGEGEITDVAGLQAVPAALVNFLQGEAAYRRGRYGEALTHYRVAAGLDSSFALASLRVAEAALWLERLDEARSAVGAALRRPERLPPPQRILASAVADYLEGRGPEAARGFREALVRKPDWVSAWAGLGETHVHYLHGPRTDSVARDAFETALGLDPDFAPALFHLAEAAALSGDLPHADSLAARLAGPGADASIERRLELLLTCARHPGDTEPLTSAAVRMDPSVALQAALSFMRGGSHLACAAEAARVVLEGDPTRGQQWGAIQILVYAAHVRGDTERVDDVIRAWSGARPEVRYLRLWTDLAAGTEAGREVAEELWSNAAGSPTSLLWLLGVWDVLIDGGSRIDRLAPLVDSLARASSSGSHAQLVASLEAYRALTMGDTALAVSGLRALQRTADLNRLAWNMWESLAPETVTLAELHLAMGNPEEAAAIAEQLDGVFTNSVPSVVFLPRSLEIRTQAARRLGDGPLVAGLNARRERLASGRATPISTREKP